MFARRARWLTLVVWIVAGLSLSVHAETITLTPIKDNTLIEVTDGVHRSNALGDAIYCGRLGNIGKGALRRAALAFDLVGAVPAEAEITSVTLTLYLIGTTSGTQTLSLHALLADWGEGTSSHTGGQGSEATPGDATWMHTFYDTDLWSTMGGDYSPAVSGSQQVGFSGAYYTWGPTLLMKADVEGWLADPSTNFGWLILGNELQLQTAKKLGSKDHFLEQWRPVLTIELVLPTQCPADFNDSGNVGAADLAEMLGSWGPCGGCPADLDDDGDVDTADLAMLMGTWGDCP